MSEEKEVQKLSDDVFILIKCADGMYRKVVAIRPVEGSENRLEFDVEIDPVDA